jgi:hypothetical protein
MNKLTSALLFFIFFAAVSVLEVSSETVMVYVTEEEMYEENGDTAKRLSYSLEGGVMDEFFERGHIVFNMGSEDNEAGDFRIDDETFPLYMAKSGGASFLLKVYLTYRKNSPDPEVDKGRLIVSSVRYDYFDVEKTESIKSGVIDAKMYFSGNGEKTGSPEEHSFTVGQILAQEALRTIQ